MATVSHGFTREELREAGFTGWIPFDEVRAVPVPPVGGVYVVVFGEVPPSFAQTSCGGWFKGRDPTVSVAALEANWVHGAEIAYTGKATSLRTRLRRYADFGAGKPVGHWGGRLIFQLSDPTSLLVAWRETPDRNPEEVEAEMITAFRAAYGKPPFANDPHLLGR